MTAQEINLQVVSAKQKGARGSVSGEGETQLELQRRLISEKEHKLRKELNSYQDNFQFIRK